MHLIDLVTIRVTSDRAATAPGRGLVMPFIYIVRERLGLLIKSRKDRAIVTTVYGMPVIWVRIATRHVEIAVGAIPSSGEIEEITVRSEAIRVGIGNGNRVNEGIELAARADPVLGSKKILRR